MRENLINDPHFHVEICPFGTSQDIEKAIWQGQHICVSENARDSQPPDNAGEAIIKHQLKVEHWSVLNFASVTMRCFGFPHSVVAQITRHRDSAFLCQSNRYTGDRFIKIRTINDVEKVFYLRPEGVYHDRKSGKIEYTQALRKDDLKEAYRNIFNYGVNADCSLSEVDIYPYEIARGLLPYDFRQDFTIHGTLKAYWHWLDQRTKKDSQLEIQTLAYMVHQELKKVCPTLQQWYEDNRYGKARLAP
jgi:thymidylate synthase (FAD)